ncbi:hypothetical protein TNCV_671161 [Trichonephila clavipes]|nr:hypothetical protein TNCV_671161 [Trichonephila clavipes]
MHLSWIRTQAFRTAVSVTNHYTGTAAHINLNVGHDHGTPNNMATKKKQRKTSPKEELLGLLPLKVQTRGEDIANAVIECMDKHHIPLDKIGSISTNGARSSPPRRGIMTPKGDAPHSLRNAVLQHKNTVVSRFTRIRRYAIFKSHQFVFCLRGGGGWKNWLTVVEVGDFCRQINLEVDSDGVLELQDSSNQKLTIHEFIEMHEQE